MNGAASHDKPSDQIRIAVLGSTGSIGTQTLEVARRFPESVKVVVLSAGSNVDLLSRQMAEFCPECVVIGSEKDVQALHSPRGCTVLTGEDGLVEAARWEGVDVVVTALVGSIGLVPTIAAVQKGRRIALANKETMVVAGDLIGEFARQHDAEIIPIDSEHSAIYQCLVGEPVDCVDRLIITASGGPFVDRPASEFGTITRTEALNHPNWSMGDKITIDSATMMNKGLELIEARWLFDIEAHRIDVTIHPQSIVHSMVLFRDGSTKAQLGPPDMMVPIQYALSAPERWEADYPVVDWGLPGKLTFSAPETDKFRCLLLAYEALEAGGTMPAVLNAANEVAVALFLAEKIPFDRIPTLIEDVMMQIDTSGGVSLSDRIQADRVSRSLAEELAGVSMN